VKPPTIISLIKGDKADPNTDYRDIMPKNSTGILREVLGAQGYMLQMPGLTQYGSVTGLSVVVTDQTIAAVAAYPDNAVAAYRIGADGVAYESDDGAVFSAISGQWLVNGGASVCEVRLTPVSGAFAGSATSVWLSCTTTRTWTVTATPGQGGNEASGLLEFRDTISLRVIASAVISPGAESFNNWVDTGACITLSGDNLIAQTTCSGNSNRVRAAFGKTTGKWYWETEANAYFLAAGAGGVSYSVGIGLSTFTDGTVIGTTATEYGFVIHKNPSQPTVTQQILKRNNGSNSALSPNFTYTPALDGAETIGYALDLDNGAFWISHNGAWLNGASEAEIEAGNTANAPFTGVTGQTFYPQIAIPEENIIPATFLVTANFGATAFAYTKPDGFSAFI
jgi:hypothetical protein